MAELVEDPPEARAVEGAAIVDDDRTVRRHAEIGQPLLDVAPPFLDRGVGRVGQVEVRPVDLDRTGDVAFREIVRWSQGDDPDRRVIEVVGDPGRVREPLRVRPLILRNRCAARLRRPHVQAG